MTDDKLPAIVERARHIERETAISALAQRMAADRWGWIFYLLGIPSVVLAAVAGASALADHPNLAAGLALGAAVASAVTTFMKPGDQADAHRRSSSRFRSIENEARNFWEVQCAGAASTDELERDLDALTTKWNTENEEAPHVWSRLYNRAKAQLDADRALGR